MVATNDQMRECPFCRSPDVEVVVNRESHEMHAAWVVCNTCAARGPYMKSEVKSVPYWNAVHRWNDAFRAEPSGADVDW